MHSSILNNFEEEFHIMLSILFPFIAVIVINSIILGDQKNWKFQLIFILWFIASALISFSGFLKVTDTLPPRILTIFLPAIFLVIYYYKSTIRTELNLKYLFFIHVMRIPVEITLHQLYEDGLVPKAMTYEGWNFDILSGISALIILIILFIKKDILSKRFLLYWNYICLALLVIIVVTAILAAPSPIQLSIFEQPNVAILKFPYTFLPAVIVPCVLLSHLLMIRKLKREINQ